jgi:uncharacterized protein YndB with AHSA1/START domain
MTNKTLIHRDFDRQTLTVERRFDAPRSRVWRAYTESVLLDQWWGPQPWKTETIRMDFRVGGHWFYSMNGPEGERHFCRMDYTAIDPEASFVSDDVFTDAEGETNPDMPRQSFTTTLTDEGATTLVVVVANYPSLDDLKAVIEMGVEQGLTMAQDQLEALLASQA